jgi:hypothetical protein
MKKVLLTIAVLALALPLMAQDAPAKKAAKQPALTAEQKETKKKLVEKYDINKDGKLDKEEKAKMSQEDKDALAKLTPKAAKKAAKDAPAPTK